MPRDDGKIALVTGASRGIGAEVAKRLAADGFAVVVNYAGSEVHADAVVRDIEAKGGRAIAIQADTSDPVAVRRMFDIAETSFGGLDVMVSNAGVQFPAAIATMSDEAFDRTIAVNLKGVFNTLREAANRIRKGGAIIAMSSGTTRVLPPELGVYAATKAGIETLTTVLAKEMRGRNVTVNTIAPGPVATDLFLTGKSPELLEAMANRSPLGRIGIPADIASAVSMLAGRDGRWINGQVILVNGGFA
jgi:3-oxoacyl-[acyl-carrier protein] reductase